MLLCAISITTLAKEACHAFTSRLAHDCWVALLTDNHHCIYYAGFTVHAGWWRPRMEVSSLAPHLSIKRFTPHTRVLRAYFNSVGTGYFGCGSGTTKRVFDEGQFRENASRDSCKMIELKISQGAKPVRRRGLHVSIFRAAVAGVCSPACIGPWWHASAGQDHGGYSRGARSSLSARG